MRDVMRIWRVFSDWDEVHCTHPRFSFHVVPLQCPECGRYSNHSWSTGVREDGRDFWIELEGGKCEIHGEWDRRFTWHLKNTWLARTSRMWSDHSDFQLNAGPR